MTRRTSSRSVTFRGRQDLKDEAIERAIEHRRYDRIRHGYYTELAEHRTPDGKHKVGVTGCAVGCLALPVNPTRASMHAVENRGAYGSLQRALGIPEVLAQFADALFEAHPVDPSQPRLSGAYRPSRTARYWPERFVKMIPVGIDLETDHAQKVLRSLPRTANTRRRLERAKRKLASGLREIAREQGVEVTR